MKQTVKKILLFFKHIFTPKFSVSARLKSGIYIKIGADFNTKDEFVVFLKNILPNLENGDLAQIKDKDEEKDGE